MEIGNEISQKIRSAIKAKLIELGAYVDDELPDYIMVMVANKKTQKQMSDDLSLFLNKNTEKFTVWLHNLLKKLQSINEAAEQSVSKPKTKEKHKGDKRKRKTSHSDKSQKSGEADKKKAVASADSNASSTVKKVEETADVLKKDKASIQTTIGKPGKATTADEEQGTEINIIENTDEFNEENKEIEKKTESAKPTSTGKPPPAKVQRSKKSTDDPEQTSKTSTRRESSSKTRTSSTSDKPSTCTESRKKPASFVVAVKRKYEEIDEPEEEYDPSNPAVGSVASVVRGPTRKSSVPKALQANRSLLMKAVSDAEKSVTTTKKIDLPDKVSSEPSMRSDRKPIDLSRRLKTAAGLQLISRSKRKELENMRYTVPNQPSREPVKKQRKSREGNETMQFTVKNDPASQTSITKISPKAKAPEVGPAKVVASAFKEISRQAPKMVSLEMKDEGSSRSDDGVSNEEDDGRSSANSVEDTDDSVIETSESGSEGEEVGMESDDESEEIEIEVTDRAAQTVVNMRDKNLTNLLVKGRQGSNNAEAQTDIVEFGVEEGLVYRLSKEKVEEIDRSLLFLFIDNTLSFEFVENEAFKMFAKSLEQKYHFPKRKKLMIEMGLLYNTVKDNLKADLTGARSVTFTHEVWCNLNLDRYDTISVHFLTEDWQLKSAVLKTTKLSEENVEEEVAQNLEEVRLKWNLTDPVAVTEDSEVEATVFEMLGWQRVPCFGRCIQKIMRNFLKTPEVAQFLNRGRDLIGELYKSSQAVEVFEQKKQLLLSEESHQVKLISDDKSNWTSTLNMMANLIEQTPALHAAVMDTELINQGVDLRGHLYNFNDQSTLELLVKIIQSFKTATEILTNNKSPTLQKILPIFVKLEKVLDKDADDHPMIQKQKSEMKKQIDSFLIQNRNICLLACIVHPQTKQMAFVSQEDKDHVKELLFQEIKSQFDEKSTTAMEGEDEGQLFRRGKKINQRQTKAMSEVADQTDVRCIVVKSEDGGDSTDENNDESEKTTNEEDDNEFEDSDMGEKSKPSTSKVDWKFGSASGVTEGAKMSGREVRPTETDMSGAYASKMTNFSITVENDWLDDVICAAEEEKTPDELSKVELDLYMAEPASSKNPLDWWKEKQLVYPKISQVARRLLAIPASSVTADEVFSLQKQSEFKITQIKPEHVDMMVFLKKNWKLYE